jgi:hypothetical protein
MNAADWLLSIALVSAVALAWLAYAAASQVV